MKDEPDWLSKTKESEERDFLLAVENSLRDQVTLHFHSAVVAKCFSSISSSEIDCITVKNGVRNFITFTQ